MNQNTFLNRFPVPRYLKIPALGLDISDRSLKYVKLEKRNEDMSVSRFGRRLIPEGIIEGGEIKDKAKIPQILASFRKEIKTDNIIASLPEEKAFLIQITVPAMSADKIKSVLELQIEEYVPLKAEEIIFDYTVLKVDERVITLNVTAYPSALIYGYRDAFKEAGFMVIAFEMEMQAAARAIIPINDPRTSLIVDFGKTRTTFAIVDERQVKFASTIAIAGEGLTQALVNALKIDVFQAETLKKERGFTKSKGNEAAFDALLPAVSSIKDEVQKHLLYWDSHAGGASGSDHKISKIILSGGESNLQGLPEYFSYELKIPAEKANPWTNIVSFDSHIPEIELDEALLYATAIGLAIRGISS